MYDSLEVCWVWKFFPFTHKCIGYLQGRFAHVMVVSSGLTLKISSRYKAQHPTMQLWPTQTMPLKGKDNSHLDIEKKSEKIRPLPVAHIIHVMEVCILHRCFEYLRYFGSKQLANEANCLGNNYFKQVWTTSLQHVLNWKNSSFIMLFI